MSAWGSKTFVVCFYTDKGFISRDGVIKDMAAENVIRLAAPVKEFTTRVAERVESPVAQQAEAALTKQIGEDKVSLTKNLKHVYEIKASKVPVIGKLITALRMLWFALRAGYANMARFALVITDHGKTSIEKLAKINRKTTRTFASKPIGEAAAARLNESQVVYSFNVP